MSPFTFTVVAPPAFQINLAPGMNLISVPGEPANGNIDAFFGDVDAVDLIFTREGSRWLLALRSPVTGQFDGTLTTIDAQHAYWIRSVATVTFQIDIPPLGAQQILPSVRVRPRQWNLVPIISLRPLGGGHNEIQNGTKLDADDYFGDNWRVAWTWDRGQWVSISPGATPQCENPDQPPPHYIGTCGEEDLSSQASSSAFPRRI